MRTDEKAVKLYNEISKQALCEVRKAMSMVAGFEKEDDAFEFIERFLLDSNLTRSLNFREKDNLIKQVYFSVRCDVGLLHPFTEDRKVTEIMVNGTDNIFVERDGKLIDTGKSFSNVEELEEIIRRIAARVHREINELTPIVDARLLDGSRVNAVYKNVALNGPALTIRRFPEKAYDMNDMIGFGSISKEAADFLEKLVVYGANVFISGGTGSGKTSMLNVLSSYIPKDERVITIEDAAELQIIGIENLVRMECKQANVQGMGAVDMQQLIKSSLRMRPNRIIVGEVRGKEVLDMLNAFNTGHDGSLSTGHGNSVRGMLKRLETMVMQAADFPIDAIRGQIVEGIDVMVHLSRMADKSRKVLEITEILGHDGKDYVLNEMFFYDKENGLCRTGNKMKNTRKMVLRGLKEEELWM
ncbi:MAG: CpaF family protein [Eubacteriales bacterium]